MALRIKSSHLIVCPFPDVGERENTHSKALMANNGSLPGQGTHIPGDTTTPPAPDAIAIGPVDC